MTRVRAKFRCMSVTKGWEGFTAVVLMPVSGNKGNCEENKQFWKYTPSGEAKLTFNKEAEVPFTAGQFYYIDFDLSEQKERQPGDWHVEERAEYWSGSYRVKLGRAYEGEGGIRSGELWMSLSVERTYAMLGPIGSYWQVAFTDAPSPEA